MTSPDRFFVRWSLLGNPTEPGDHIVRLGEDAGTTVEVGPGLINGRSKYSGDPVVEVEYSPAGQGGVWSAVKFTTAPDKE